MSENEIAKVIVNTAFDLHRQTGPGMLERIYTDCLAHLLQKQNLKVEKEKPVPFKFDGISFGNAFRLDLLVENKVIVEVKSVSELRDVHMA